MDEETKQKLLEELRKEYRVELKPLPVARLNMNEVLNKYMDEICERLDVDNNWRNTEIIRNVVRRIMCFKHRCWTIQEIPHEEYDSFKEDTEKFINQILLGKE